MQEFLKELGINVGISVAGLFGSLLLIGKAATVNLRATFFSLVSGVASANYITPVVIDIGRVDQKYQLSVAFILGFLGLKGVELFSNKFIKKSKENVDN